MPENVTLTQADIEFILGVVGQVFGTILVFGLITYICWLTFRCIFDIRDIQSLLGWRTEKALDMITDRESFLHEQINLASSRLDVAADDSAQCRYVTAINRYESERRFLSDICETLTAKPKISFWDRFNALKAFKYKTKNKEKRV